MAESSTVVAAARTDDAAGTRAVGAAVGALLQPGDVVVLTGELGAGKTMFTSGVGDALGVDDAVVSPTYTIVHELHGRHRLAHADLYRVADLVDLDATGIETYLSASPEPRADDWIVVVEWGESAGQRLGRDRCEVAIVYGAPDEPDGVRRFVFRVHGGRWSERVTHLRQVLAPWTTDPGTSAPAPSDLPGEESK